MGIGASKEAAEARSKEIATIKAVAASLDDAGRPASAKPSGAAGTDSTAGSNHAGAKVLKAAPASPPRPPNNTKSTNAAPFLPTTVSEFVSMPAEGGGKPLTVASDSPSAGSADTTPAPALAARSSKLTPSDFVLLKTIGQGSFGLVLQVNEA